MKNRYSWNVIDLVTAAVLAIASGFIFLGWNLVYAPIQNIFTAITPGFSGSVLGIWLIGGVIGGLIIRKPGAALFVELLAAIVEMALGSQWGISAVYSGLLQGLFAEIIFLIFLYTKSTLLVACLAGGSSAIGDVVHSIFSSGFLAKNATYQITYLISDVLSGVILAGIVSWVLMIGLARAGALDKFPVGREMIKEI